MIGLIGVTKEELTLSLPSDVMCAPICAPNWEAMLIPLTGEVGGPFLLKNFFRSHSKENILWKDRRNLKMYKKHIDIGRLILLVKTFSALSFHQSTYFLFITQ